MRIHELSAAECEAVLARCDLGRLACARDNQPYVVPIHYSFDPARKCLYAFSAIGQKITWMRQNPKVCVEIEDVTDRDRWLTVLVFGRFEEMMGDSVADQTARRTAEEFFSKRREWWLPAAAKVGSHEPHAVIIYRIHVDRMTGRRASRARTTH